MFRLIESGGRWALYDVVWDQASVVANYRSRFSSVTHTSSVAQLLEQMRTDPPRQPEPRAQTPLAPDRLATGLLLAVLTRHASPK